MKARLQGKVIKALVNLDRESPVISSVRLDVEDGRYFNPDNLIRSVISVPMLRRIEADENSLQSVMIEVNANYPSGRPGAKARVMELINQTIPKDGSSGFVSNWKMKKANSMYMQADWERDPRRTGGAGSSAALGTRDLSYLARILSCARRSGGRWRR